MVDSEGGKVMRTKTTISLSDINNESNKPSVYIPVRVITVSDCPQTLIATYSRVSYSIYTTSYRYIHVHAAYDCWD